MIRQCQTCAAWIVRHTISLSPTRAGTVGICRLNPPSLPDPENSIKAWTFPRTWADDWCLQWREKPEEPPNA